MQFIQRGDYVPRSEAQKRADKKYNAKYDAEHMRLIGIKVPVAEKELYQQWANNFNIPLARYIRLCCRYCIDNNINVIDTEHKPSDQETSQQK